MDELEEFRATFFQECEELLADLEGQLAALKDGTADDETLHAAFRAIHSVKGGAGAFGPPELVSFAHVFETVLDHMRSDKLDLDGAGVDLLLRAGDILNDLVTTARSGGDATAALNHEVLAALQELAGGGAPKPAAEATAPSPPPAADPPPVADPTAPVADPPAPGTNPPAPAEDLAEDPDGPSDPAADAGPPSASRTVHIHLVPQPQLFQRANDPLLLIRELKTLGAFEATVDLERLPKLEDLDPEGPYLRWTFALATDQPTAAIEEVFEFVADDCELRIEDPATADGAGAFEEKVPAAEAVTPEPDPDREPDPDPSPATESGVDLPTPAAVPAPPEPPTAPATEPAAPAPAGLAAPAGPAAPETTTPPTAKAKPAASGSQAAAHAGGGTIRVDLEKIDRLVNMVGELVITQAMLTQQSAPLAVDQHAGLIAGIEALALQSRDLQESVMAIRAQPVKSVFSRMSRLVRELAASLGKEVRLVISGEYTEVDKTVIEELADPLTHMIRNSMDHGIEGPEKRAAAGKPREGVIHLSAEHRSGRIVIAVADDGQGINRERVLLKAREKGLVAQEAQLTDEEIDNLILLPGFSTAETVSNVSGRGVGMDVVRRNIQGMGGRLSISSTPGQGSRFVLALPLTLAVLDGMIVKVGAESYIMPITSIVESLHPEAHRVHRLAGGGQVLSLRGNYIRLVFLSRLFGIENAKSDPTDALVVVVEIEDGNRIGIVVDELLGQQQVVIKSLESNHRRVDGISGATILGNGMVALILDVDRLSQMAHADEPSRIASAAA